MKKFSLATIITVTTGRLLSPMGDLYEILGHMTNDSPMTHQLGRFGEECKPWLLKWFPEVAVASACLASLDKWIASDRTGTNLEGIKMWLTELRMMFPDIKTEYEVGQIPADDHIKKNPFDELIENRGTDEGIIVLSIENQG